MIKFSIYLVRHAETLFNVKRMIQGWSDAPLTKIGVEQASVFGEIEPIDKIEYFMTSDLKRAEDTLELILNSNGNSKNQYIKDINLREFNFGQLEGERIRDGFYELFDYNNVTKDFFNRLDIFSQYEMFYHEEFNDTADTLEIFVDRIESFLEETIRIAKSEDVSNIMAVSHGVTIQSIIYHLTKDISMVKNLNNVSVTRLDYDGNKFNIKYIGNKTLEMD